MVVNMVKVNTLGLTDLITMEIGQKVYIKGTVNT